MHTTNYQCSAAFVFTFLVCFLLLPLMYRGISYSTTKVAVVVFENIASVLLLYAWPLSIVFFVLILDIVHMHTFQCNYFAVLVQRLLPGLLQAASSVVLEVHSSCPLYSFLFIVGKLLVGISHLPLACFINLIYFKLNIAWIKKLTLMLPYGRVFTLLACFLVTLDCQNLTSIYLPSCLVLPLSWNVFVKFCQTVIVSWLYVSSMRYLR